MPDLNNESSNLEIDLIRGKDCSTIYFDKITGLSVNGAGTVKLIFAQQEPRTPNRFEEQLIIALPIGELPNIKAAIDKMIASEISQGRLQADELSIRQNLKSNVEVKCQHCGHFFPSPLPFNSKRNFDLAQLKGNRTDCPYCGHMTGVDKEHMRATFPDSPEPFIGELAKD
ncbi:hypothetical protein [Alkanindiges illinoisensis]|uniref:Uncharacterized protein n=1 Tax=Alkanindiges illinoisensis TaxID=197183 RepID=A0A4Y7XFV6_9GAMM|nr:hypothetical protein [Alkanindiges illinoisensis]TEU30109.1 hypothetical protein E2B99_03460 [Alkanindiges illinoisensis]